MFADWLADRALDLERVALEQHQNSINPLAAEAWLRVAEGAEDVRLWIDRLGSWRELRRARKTSRARRRRSRGGHPMKSQET